MECMRFVVHLNRETVQRFEQSIHIISDKMNEMDLKRVVCRRGFGLINHRFGKRECIFAAWRDDVPDCSLGSIDCLCSFICVQISPGTTDGRGCANDGL